MDKNLWTTTIRKLLPTMIFLITNSGLDAFGQNCDPVGAPSWTNFTFQTVGGVTYFTHVASVPDGSKVESGPVVRSGTNLFQSITEKHCLDLCFDCYHSETHVSVLGVLEPGNYRFIVSSQSGFDPPGSDLIFFIEVPVSPERILSSSVSTNNLNLAVAGIPHVEYTIEASTTMTNWTAVKTNIGAPFIWSQPVTTNAQQFFRIQAVGQ